MKGVTAKEAMDRFGRLIDSAQREPVRIDRHGRAVAVMLSAEEYGRLEAVEDAWWAMRAKEAEKEGPLGPVASERLLRDLPNASD